MTEALRSKLNTMGDGCGLVPRANFLNTIGTGSCLVPRVVIHNTAFALFLQRKAKISFCKSYKLAGSATDVKTSICTDPDRRQVLSDTEIPVYPGSVHHQAVSMHIAMFLILF